MQTLKDWADSVVQICMAISNEVQYYGSFTDRTGEININNFGSEMVIVKYRNARDIDVFFSEYDWTAKSVEYENKNS